MLFGTDSVFIPGEIPKCHFRSVDVVGQCSADCSVCKRFAIFDFILLIHRQRNVWIICFIGKNDSLAVYTCIDLACQGLFRHNIR